MTKKFIITSELRKLEKMVSLGEISYSRMIEMLNEKADLWAKHKSDIAIDVYGKIITLPFDNYVLTLEKCGNEIVNQVTKFQNGTTVIEPIFCKNYGVTSDEFLQDFYNQEVQFMIKNRK